MLAKEILVVTKQLRASFAISAEADDLVRVGVGVGVRVSSGLCLGDVLDEAQQLAGVAACTRDLLVAAARHLVRGRSQGQGQG